MINRLFLCSLALMLWAGATRAQTKQNYNLDIEQLDAQTKQPTGWDMTFSYGGAKGYIVKPDAQTVKSGKYALTILPDANKPDRDFGACAYVIPAKYQGKTIELRGYMKLKNVGKDGHAGLWMRIDGEEGEPSLAFDNMRKRKINGTRDWQEYKVSLPLSKYALKIHVGGLLTSQQGQMWIDNLRLYIDGTPLAKVATRAYPPKERKPSIYFEMNKANVLKEWQKFEKVVDTIKQKVPHFGFYAALVHQGKIIRETSNGMADRKKKLPMSADVVHAWGSISKMFTSIAILQLVEKGKIKLTDPITKYLPELGKGVDSLGGMQAIKIHHLLNHNSGYDRKPVYNAIADKFPEFENRVANSKEIKPFLKYASQKFRPGSKYQYNNGAYSLLGMVIERVTDRKYIDYIKQHILKPLGMSTAHYDKTPQKLQPLFGTSYRHKKDGKISTGRPDESAGIREANGGLKAKVADMLKFMDFLKFRKRTKYLKRYEKVLPRTVLEKYYFDLNLQDSTQYTRTYKTTQHGFYFVNGFVNTLANEGTKNQFEVMGHSGSVHGFLSNFIFRKETKVPYGIILMINTSGQRETPERVAFVLLYNQLRYLLRNIKIDSGKVSWRKIAKRYK
ncbi:serine hydrolase [uncultured Microscilla sp.]|uniref:serine hydrolase domain-containing protein n=1 Tax=uncultured Microscilla sp. TaxID=432653 RepID=UPI0026107342|nr:serine hydrolase domain-containing protein [uncultured Microscilla sp.]